jgi:small subunit ribosomal protein S1
VHISELADQHVEAPEQVVQVGQQVRVKVVDVDVSRRRISLSMRRVSDEEAEVLPEPEIHAEPTEALVEDLALEPSPETAEAVRAADARGDEGEPEALEALVEPEPAAPEEAAMHVVPPEPEGADEDISLESIVEELKRREGRS